MAKRPKPAPIILDEHSITTVSATPSKSLAGPDVSTIRGPKPPTRKARVKPSSLDVPPPVGTPDPTILLTPEELADYNADILDDDVLGIPASSGIPTIEHTWEDPFQPNEFGAIPPCAPAQFSLPQGSPPGVGDRPDPATFKLPQVSTPVPRTDPSLLDRMLNIKWSKFIPLSHSPFPKQLAALMLSDAREVFFGGAAGGGKSDWLLMEALRFCDLPTFSSIIFRKQLTDLKQSGGLIPRAEQWLAPMKEAGHCRYAGDEHKWHFKTFWPGTDIPGPEATLQWGYIGEASVRDRYMSAEFQLIGFEELANWEADTDFVYMYSRLRKNMCVVHGSNEDGEPIYKPGCRYCDVLSQIPLRMRAASNPGPSWIKRRYGIIPDPTQYKTRHEALVAISEGHKVRWVGTNKEKPFIPSYLSDNKAINAKEYRASLSNMSEDDRSKFEDGNWEARKNSRFKRRWQRFYQLNAPQELLMSESPMFRFEELELGNTEQIPIKYDLSNYSYSFTEVDRSGNVFVSDPIPLTRLSSIFTTVDTAVTTRQGPVDGEVGQKNSYAVISTWGLTHNNNLLWLNMRKFRKEIPDLVQQLVDVNSIWKPNYNKIEVNGVGTGVAQYAEAAKMNVRKNYRKTDKLENSLSAQMLMKNGLIWFPINALWLEECEDDVFSWTGLPNEEDDVIDTLCDACHELALGVAHTISAPSIVRTRPRVVFTSGAIRGIPKYGLNN
jgi:phage terminase large subunit-like protein